MKIMCQEYYAKTLLFAKSIGKEEHFRKKIEYLNRFGNVELHKDFAPHSFCFVVFRDDVPIMNGGLIYHGYDNGTGGAPSFSVSLTDSDGWEIHT